MAIFVAAFLGIVFGVFIVFAALFPTRHSFRRFLNWLHDEEVREARLFLAEFATDDELHKSGQVR